MSSTSTICNAALNAFDSWSLTAPQTRCQVLESIKDKMPPAVQSAYDYQLFHGKKIVVNEQSLISPTGETNELYVQGRGVSVLLVDSEDEAVPSAAVAMMVALMVAGNSVILCTDNETITSLFKPLMADTSMPGGLIHLAASDDYSALLNEDIRNFAAICDKQTAISLNKELAARPNAITSLVAETDMATLANSQDPMLTLRFVTERVRTINITAIGGNAMLLELGSDKH